MKIEHVYPDYVTRQIEAIDRRIVEIEREYLEKYLRSLLGVCTMEMDYRDDWRVKRLEELKCDIYKRAVYTTIITAENEEEKKILNERILMNEDI